MLAELLPKPAYRQYRLRLEASLQIAVSASEQEIHELIAAGFAAERVIMLSELGVYDAAALNQIIPLGTLNTRLARSQRLSLGESDRLFRLAHVTAMAEALFGGEPTEFGKNRTTRASPLSASAIAIVLFTAAHAGST